MIARWQTEKVRRLLGLRRGVNLTGARQVGKSTLARALDLPNAALWTLDDARVRGAAIGDPPSFVKHEAGQTLVIDEIQKVPELLEAIKMVVDRDNSRGQYLLTGSANLRFAKKVKDSLAGRLGYVRLRPFSLGELNGNPPRFLDAAFGRDFQAGYAPMDKRDVIRAAFAGGYPEVQGLAQPDRIDWFQTYVDELLTKDIQDVTEIRKLDALRSVAVWIFAHTAQFFAADELAAKVSISKETLGNFFDALRAMYLYDSVPAWAKSGYALAGKRPKFIAADSGLVAACLRWGEGEVYLDEPRNGRLVETWAYNQLAAVADTDSNYSISHYRDSKKREIDFLVERIGDGALLGVEVKSGTVGKDDFKHLRWFAANLAKDRSFTGIVLYSGEHTLRFGEGFYAVPLAALGA